MRRPGHFTPAGAAEPALKPEGEGFPVPAADGASDVFRETFLAWVTEPALNRALRVLSRALHDMVLEHGHHWPQLPGSLDVWDLRAVAGDLRHLQGVLERIAREPDESQGTARRTEGTPLSVLAADDAEAVAEIAARIESDLAACPAEPEP